MHEVQERFAGAIIDNVEKNGYHDSDFFAIVYDEEADTVKMVQTGTTRAPSFVGKLPVDITDENLAKAQKAAERQAYGSLKFDAQRAAEKVEPGKTVRFLEDFNGRTQPKAKAGELLNVATVYENRFTYGHKNYYGERVPEMIAKGWTSDGREIALATHRFEVVDPEQYIDEDELKQKAANWAERAASTKNFRGILMGWVR